MAFQSEVPSGKSIVMDATPETGGMGLGPTPVESLISSVAACSAMDVISILTKKRQEVTSYHIEVAWTRGPEDEFPRPVTSVTLTHVVSGVDIDESAVARSVELSDTKYCTVINTLRLGAVVTSNYRVS